MDLEEFSEKITESIEGLSSYVQALEEFVRRVFSMKISNHPIHRIQD